VLDTWFSSWLWPFATFYWPFNSDQPSAINRQPNELKEWGAKIKQQKADLDYFYPTSTLLTAPEIIFFWVARMIMAGFEFKKQIPFKDVYFHGTVRDSQGRKMSKSLGNAIDPLEIIAEYGTDALRFSLISIATQGQDIYLSKERFEQGRNFANKIWNASRFVLANLKPEDIKQAGDGSRLDNIRPDQLDIVNQWILSRFYATLEKTENELEDFRFNEAVNGIYAFFWHEFCDWYLELIKPQINQKQTQLVMFEVLEKTMRLIHPFMPFISEEIWQRLRGQGGQDSIMQQNWPTIKSNFINQKIESQMSSVFDLINTIRNMRTEMEINPGSRIDILLTVNNKDTRKTLELFSEHIKNLAKINSLVLNDHYLAQNNQYTVILKDLHIVIPLAGVVDITQQIKKTDLKIDKLKFEIKNKEAMLANKSFTARAPKEIVETEKNKLTDMQEQIKKLEMIKNGLR